MSSVVVIGWRNGFQKIPMTKLIRAYTSYGLEQGKRCVDDILEGKPVALPQITGREAEHFISEARELGAICTMPKQTKRHPQSEPSHP